MNRLLRKLPLIGLTAVSFAFIACGGDSTEDVKDDTPDELDPTGTHTKYVVNKIDVPATASASKAVAQDLDGDGIVDNALGGLLASLAGGAANLDLQTGVDTQLNDATFTLLLSIKATDLVDANGVGTYFFFGENPTPAACTDAEDPLTCGQHLDGSASFNVTANSPSDAVLRGTLAAGGLNAGPGSISIELPLGDIAPLQLDLIAARLVADVSADGIATGKLAGAITSKDVDENLMPKIQELVAQLIVDDCAPADGVCNCTADSPGASVVDFFDDNDDCEIPLAELMADTIIDSTVRNPDLDLLDADGNYAPNSDGIKDSLSIAIGFTAVGAAFELPAGVE